jgi:hypothetical protein
VQRFSFAYHENSQRVFYFYSRVIQNAMAKKSLTKTQLINAIEAKVQELNLLQSAIKAERSRKPEVFDEYQKKYAEILERS